VKDVRATYRPVPAAHRGTLEALVYLGPDCLVHSLPDGGVVRVGRGSNNEIRIDDPSVSRAHCALYVGHVLEIEDLGSANGTLLLRADQQEAKNGESRLRPGERRCIEPGTIVRAGVALLAVQPRSAAPALRASSSAGPEVLLDPEMKRVYEAAMRAAASDISVLITGETGSGKEILAESIHRGSNRRERPFLRLNCASLSETLLESELFGHERGAFTGANQTKPGLLESTDGGTVFLDEIGEMPLSVQAKLLRVLEERSILRLGATKPRRIDVRFIWATNRNLRAEARAGRFRNDLYYRVAGAQFAIPPLRARASEIEPLARLFLARACRRSGRPVPQLSEGAVSALHRYSWPGNVRELRNVIEWACLACEGGPISEHHVPQEHQEAAVAELSFDQEATRVFPMRRASAADANQIVEAAAASEPGAASSDDVERMRVLQALEQCAGNQTRAAKVLGVSRRTLINRLERLNLPRPKKGQ
jgi:DNA-binding NtrC family response regulator